MKNKCGICGSTSLHDLGHSETSTTICLKCDAYWWGLWRTKKEHQDLIDKQYNEEKAKDKK